MDFLTYEILSTGALLLLVPGKKKPPVGDVTQADIEALDLAPSAKKAAYLLRQKYPTIKFTSGHRTPASQASAMATNIIKTGNRNWVSSTYKASTISTAIQSWVTANPSATTQAALSAGILGVLNAQPAANLGSLSKHLLDPSQAFDVAEQTGTVGTQIVASMTTLGNMPGCKFLNGESGVAVWHLQIAEPTTLPTTL